MKVETVTVQVLKVPVDRPYRAGRMEIQFNWHVLARLTTADGVQGFGYVVALQQNFVKPLAAATRELAGQLVGMHVLEVEAAWARMARAGGWIGPGGLLHYAIAPLDLAMWDAGGKSLGQPLYRLLGGYRDRVPVYASDGFWYSLSLEELAASARASVAQGFGALKLRLGHEASPQDEARRVISVREAVPEGILILADAAESWDVNQATSSGRALREAGIYWLEDPINHQDLMGLARLRNQLDVPIAAGEHLYLLNQFARLLGDGAAGFAIIDLGRVGGITPWRRIAALAETFNVPVCGHVLPEVHVHLLASVPNGHMVGYVPRSAAILEKMPALQDGCLVAPRLPGLGLALDEEAVRRYMVSD